MYIRSNRYTIEITPNWVKIQLFIFMSKVNLGTLPSIQNTFSVLLNSVCAVTALITKCDKSQIATARIPELSQFVTVAICDGSKYNFSDRFHSNRGYTPKCRKHVHIKIGPFQEGFLGTSIMSFITEKHTHKHIYQWITPKWAKIQLFMFMSKVNLGTLPCTQNTFSVLLDSVCAVTALITNCDKSQIATIQESLPSYFVIGRILWSWPWRHKLSPITLHTCSGYLGEYPCSLLTWIWNVAFCPFWRYFTVISVCVYVYQL